MKGTRIVVLGSLNYDIIALASAMPRKGETRIGHAYKTFCGGKGANQAVQAAKLGAETYMIGRVGKDKEGGELLKGLMHAGVNTDFITLDEAGTGVGIIHFDTDGNYQSIVVPNGNGNCTGKDVDEAEDIIKHADALMCQLEITEEAVDRLMEMASQYEIPVILNPAPAKTLDRRFFERAHVITPNETEASFYSEIPPEVIVTETGRRMAATRMLELGAQRVAITLGSQGSYYYDGKEEIFCPAYKIRAVDTAAAGDSFNAALCFAITNGRPMQEALQFANAAGALTASREGAQESIGDLEMIHSLMSKIGE